MSDGARANANLRVDTSPRGIAISKFYGHWSPGTIGPILTALYDRGCITITKDGRVQVVKHKSGVSPASVHPPQEGPGQ